jgi:hypothetical protein
MVVVDVDGVGEPRIAVEGRPLRDSVYYLMPTVSAEEGRVMSTY